MGAYTLNPVDVSIVIGYLLFVVILGFVIGSKHKDAEDYFLAGRNLTWPLIGFSLFASNMSSNSLVGLTGAGYVTGFSVFSYEWMAVLVLIIFAVFFLPFYLKSRIYTVPEYLERRFNYFVRAYASVIAIILNVLVDIAATLYAGGVLIQLIFPQFPLWMIIGALAIIAGLYTISGGLSAVVYTDAVQAVILIAGSMIITWFAWEQSGGFSEVMKITEPSHMNIIKSAKDSELPWPGLFGVFLIGFYFWGTNQYITQRTLAAKSTLQGQWGSMFAGFLKLSILFIMIFPGVFARVLYPEVENVDQLYPTMLFDLLPTGILGLVLAGFIAALMSSIDSGLNSVSTLVTMDFVAKYRPSKSPESLMKVGRWVTFIVMIIATAWAPQITHFDKLWDYLQQALSWFCPPIIALFIVGLLWKKANTTGAISAIIFGSAITIFSIATQGAPWKPHFLYMATIHTALSALAMIIGSFFGQHKTSDELKNVVWSIDSYRAETAELVNRPWYQNYRYHGLILVAVVILILLVY
ncbi:MAG: sodium:solute symporter [Cyclobacteriaceae bacterium]